MTSAAGLNHLHRRVERLILASDLRTESRRYGRPMRGVSRGDVGLALAVAAVGQVDVLAPDLVGVSMVEPRWVVASSYLVMSAVLVLRRVRPLLTFLVVLGAMSVQVVAVGATEGNGVLLPGLVAAYSLAAHGRRRDAIAGLALLPMAIALRELNNPDNSSAEDVVNAIGWDLALVAAWLLGAWLRTRRQLMAELEGRAVAAEQAREERAAAAVVAERARIGRELHDVVAHSVAVIVVQAEAAEELLGRDPDRVTRALRAIQGTGRDTLDEMRRLLGALAPGPDGADGPAPGTAALPALVERVRATGLVVDAEVADLPAGVSPAVDRAVYRLVQESLTNVLKHAGASRASVRLGCGEGGVEVEVVDDGSGGDLGDGGGRGLPGMRERVAVHGGRFEAGRGPTGGFVVRAWLPLEQPVGRRP